MRKQRAQETKNGKGARGAARLLVAAVLLGGCGGEPEGPGVVVPVGWSESLGTPKVKRAPNPSRDVDWNGDGFADLVTLDTSRDSNWVAFYPGGETGIRFDEGHYRRAPGASYAPLTWVSHAGDVDADGYSDLLVGKDLLTKQSQVFLYRGGPNGPTDPEAVVLEESTPPTEERLGPRGYPAGDLNGDGFADVLVIRFFTHLAVHYGAAGGPNGKPDLELANDGGGRQILGAVPVGDLQNDGYDDVLIAWQNPNTDELAVNLHLGGPSGLATEGPLMPGDLTFGNDFGRLGGLSFDFDADGTGDLVGFNWPNGFLLPGPNDNDEPIRVWYSWLRGDAAGFFGNLRGLVSWKASSPVYGKPSEGVGADVNGDGHTDVIGSYELVDDGTGPLELNTIRGIGGFFGGPARAEQEVGGLDFAVPINQQYIDAANTNFFARAAGCPGDIDGDGFEDCVQIGESRVFLYRGSPEGLRLAEERLLVTEARTVATRATLVSKLFR
ncbi:FG-GAP repeat domain-containing protein [Polyangium spumosum]|nr:VCBS repeat-containing protein [Polyangium spumosum]